MPYDLRRLGLTDTLRCGAELRRIGNAAHSIEEGAQAMVEFLYRELVDGRTGDRACALVRCYKTHRYAELPDDLKKMAAKGLGRRKIPDEMRCMVLVGSAGDRPEWMDRHQSEAHQVIPLAAATISEREPMIAQMVAHFGLDLDGAASEAGDPVQPPEGAASNVFCIPRAKGSPLLADQEDFVLPERIESVVAFGGVLRSGELLATILFARVAISDEAASRFRTVALDMRAGLFAAGQLPTFRRAG